MTWSEWAKKHSVRFGMDREQDLASLSDWARMFSRRGYTPDELSDATDRMLDLPDPPRYRDAQLWALERLVRDARAGRFAQPAARPEPSACRLCGGDGYLGVPDYGAMAKYEATFKREAPRQTQTVHCRCPLGLWKSKQPKRALQSLAEYEEANGGRDWRADLEAWREEARERASLHARAGELDRTLGKLMRKWKGAGDGR